MQSKKIEVRCDCPAESKKTIGSLAQKIFAGAKNLEVLINQNPLDLLTPLVPSAYKIMVCGACEGRGFVDVADGPEDYQKVECGNCNGTGKVLADN